MCAEIEDQMLIIVDFIMCRGVVVILHGLNEHRFVRYIYRMQFYLLIFYLLTSLHFFNSGRYGDFAKKLNANGLKVYGMDWIGKWTTFEFDC